MHIMFAFRVKYGYCANMRVQYVNEIEKQHSVCTFDNLRACNFRIVWNEVAAIRATSAIPSYAATSLYRCGRNP